MASNSGALGASNDILVLGRFTATQFGILCVCFFSMMLDGFDIAIIAYTAPFISDDWSIRAEQLGVVFSAGLLGMTLGSMFMASLADIYGRRVLVSLALIMTGAATVAVAYIGSVTELVILRFICGLGLGSLLAVVPALAGEYSPASYRNFIVAIMVAGTSTGSVVGGLISAWFIPEYGWRALFFYNGVANILVGTVYFLAVPESITHLVTRRPRDALGKINRVLAYIGHDSIERLPERQSLANDSATVRALLTPSRRTMTLLVWGAFAALFAVSYFVTSWLPKLLVNAGFPSQDSIYTVVILTFGGILGTALIGYLSRWFTLNRLVGLSLAMATVLTVLLSLLMRGGDPALIPWIWALSFGVGVTLMGSVGNLYSIAMVIYPPHIKITGIGWCCGIGRAVAIISPALAGLLLGMGVAAAAVLALFAIAIALAGIFTNLLRVREMQ
ncbi:MAG: MFS transporter [Porticoccaceae bacterium]